MRATPVPKGGTRRKLGAALAICGLLLIVTFALGARWWFGYSTQSFVVDVGDGTLYTKAVEDYRSDHIVLGFSGGGNGSYNSKTGIARTWSWTWWHWGKREDWTGGNAYSIWPIAPLCLCLGLALLLPGLREARRIRKNQCPGCGYSRTGLAADASCPECARKS